MTSPLLSSRNSPRKVISENSDTRSPASSRLAQLISKFEFLDAVASVGNSPRASPNSKLVTAISPPSVVGLTASKTPKRKSQGSTITRERSSIDSRFSPVRFATSSLEPALTRRAQTFGTKSPIVPISNTDTKSRQKSVAERRMIFEAATEQPGKHGAGSIPLRIY